eukprot:TRINITY_DN36091_c0_g1_i1.p1 TRINITY_DN36091_c0_g1~~TRINITY_DN36091_c0_g1_i1.p1  ORF type:complete len:760 (-),score=135.75 TRINITY_DN36091_c0_g1_i1:91-2370(-)
MSCCCIGGGEEDVDDDKVDEGNPGPDIARSCTDFPCLCIFVVYCLALLGILYGVLQVSDVRTLTHGKDHYGNVCGKDEDVKDRKLTYFPDLQSDFSNDKYLKNPYGICVEDCPPVGPLIGKDGDKNWFVSLPSLPIAGRCVPYKPEPIINGTLLCAYPVCKPVTTDQPVDLSQLKPEQICGLRKDGTAAYWLLGKPDEWLKDGWKEQGYTENEVAAFEKAVSNLDPNYKNKCEVLASRETSVRLYPAEEQALYSLLTQYTGRFFRQAAAVLDHRYTVLGFGVALPVVLSFFIICFLTCCIRYILITMTILLFVVLSVADYILFVQAGFATGNTGREVFDYLHDRTNIKNQDAAFQQAEDTFKDMLTQAAGKEDQMLLWTYQFLAIALFILLALLVCATCFLRKNFEIVVRLLQEASRTIRVMPSLLLAPFFCLAGMAVAGTVIAGIAVGIMSMERDKLLELFMKHEEMIGTENMPSIFEYFDKPEAFQDTQRYLLLTVLIGYLWVYFFQHAVFISTVSYSVSHWYFYREDPERNAGTGVHSKGWFFGRPLLIAFCKVIRHHMGSCAMGSFMIVLVTLPRIALEYLDQQTKQQQELNQVLKIIIQAARCCLWCLQNCLKFITEYTYVHVVMSGRSFCPAARKSFALLAQYPIQVSMDKMASAALSCVVCVTVPTAMALLTYCTVTVKEWIAVVGAVVALSVVTTKGAVSVYDIAVTTLFVCAMHDEKHYGGRYVPEALGEAMGLSKDDRRRAAAEIEMHS